MKHFDFSGIQRLGRALMLPIAVLPAAALLLRFGQGDLLNLPFMAAAGAAIFDNLGLLFAVGIAVGLARENHGAAGLAGAVGYLVIIKGAGALLAVPPDIAAAGSAAVWRMEEAARMGTPAGILSGLTAGWLYNRCHAVKLPDYLAFFGGRRFVPIVTGVACLCWAFFFGKAWPLLASGLDGASALLSEAGDAGLFVYGVLNRLLIVTGLHHIVNNVVWFLHGSFAVAQEGMASVVTGDLNRFFAGDPTAGAFMSGFFPVMMFGLPGACLAMYRNALPGEKQAAGGLLLSMALTSFLTGITEPIEFAFMFLAPALYALHALLTGLALVVMNVLGVRLGFGFSAGCIDYVINFGISTKPLLLIPVGAAYFALYYLVFGFVIRRFHLRTIGREDAGLTRKHEAGKAPAKSDAPAMIAALGGADNVLGVSATDTRLRFALADGAAVDRQSLRKRGALGFALSEEGVLEVVVGPGAGEAAAALLSGTSLRGAVSPPGLQPAAEGERAERTGTAGGVPSTETEQLIFALGGSGNIVGVDACATRLRLTVRKDAAVDEKALFAAGAFGVVRPGLGSVQVVLGPRADVVCTMLRDALRRADGTPGGTDAADAPDR